MTRRREIANAFKQARKAVAAEPEGDFICIILQHYIKTPGAMAARGIIQIRMGEPESIWCGAALEEWLQKKHGISYKLMTPEQMKAYRLRWLDALIVEFGG